MKISFLLYPTQKVKVDEDTSFWIFYELQRRGHDVTAFESSDMTWQDGRLLARLTEYRLDPKAGYGNAKKRPIPQDLSRLDAIFIRKEPPFDTEYLYDLQLLSRLSPEVFILNDPAGIALCNEKLFILDFPALIPETLVTCRMDEARCFIEDLRARVVVKPLDQKGGSGIVMTERSDRNLPSLLEQATLRGARRVLVQRFLEHDEAGDKRILLLNGRPIGCFLRRPTRRDFRANLGVGGSFHRAKIVRSDQRLIEAIAPEIVRRGLYFVGLDVIRGKLSEVNVTSPSGIPEIHRLERKRPEKDVADFIEQRLGSSSGRRRS